LDLSQQQGQQLVQMMSQSVQPNLVKHVDLRIYYRNKKRAMNTALFLFKRSHFIADINV
jgi:hypothetical protein